MPAYGVTYKTIQGIRSNEAETWLIILALGKLFFGLTFYAVYFQPCQTYARIDLLASAQLAQKPALSKALKWVILMLIGGLISAVGSRLGLYLLSYVH
jgi:hypothetical protein